MADRVGFWFYVGDWMKDPELRFCSLFARGLLVDLLCIMFEAKHQGQLARPDGSPRTDSEIVDAISGGTRDEKLNALNELITSGALKRNENTGVLYSSRLMRLNELSRKKREAGKKGGDKRAANATQTPKQNSSNQASKTGVVSDTDSASDSDGFTLSKITPVIDSIPKEIAERFILWVKGYWQKHGQWVPLVQQEALLMKLLGLGTEKAIADLDLSIEVCSKRILDSSWKFGTVAELPVKTYGQRIGGGAW
jgi:hypothetical protein